MASIALEGVTKEFPGGAVAVRSLDLVIDDGEFLVLVGPSGSGKTTVLRMVAGLEESSAGVIRIGEHVVNDLAPRDRDIAMVFQNYALYPHMTVFENMAFGLRLRKAGKDEIRRRVEHAADLLGLRPLLGRRPRQLSGGQRQRVAMGRAIVREPAAFLMDEPLSNLDAKLRVQMRTEIGRLHQRLRTTTMYVTHDQTEAITMADRVAVMRDGTLQQLDSPQVLYDDPVNLFVAGFIGSPAMNLVGARLSEDGGRVWAAFGSHRLVVPPAVLDRRPGARALVGRDVVLGIRPEDLEDAEFAPRADPDETVEVAVAIVEPLGAEVTAHFEVDAPPVTTADTLELAADVDPGAEVVGGSGTTPAATGERATFTARLHPRTTVRAGRTVKMTVDVERLHLFDPASGRTLR